jgi:hypothetical protein
MLDIYISVKTWFLTLRGKIKAQGVRKIGAEEDI